MGPTPAVEEAAPVVAGQAEGQLAAVEVAPAGGTLPVGAGQHFRDTCVQPADKSRYPHCRALWARAAMHG